MVGIVLASHGGFADGIAESAQMLFGPQDNFAHVILKPSEGPDDIKGKMSEAIASSWLTCGVARLSTRQTVCSTVTTSGLSFPV